MFFQQISLPGDRRPKDSYVVPCGPHAISGTRRTSLGDHGIGVERR